MTCPTCNEDYMGCDRYGCWKTPDRRAVTEAWKCDCTPYWDWQKEANLHAVGCPKEFAILSNSQNKPQYSLAVTYLIGAVILVCMGTGIYLGVRFGY